jgi:hypothetical protein
VAWLPGACNTPFLRSNKFLVPGLGAWASILRRQGSHARIVSGAWRCAGGDPQRGCGPSGWRRGSEDEDPGGGPRFGTYDFTYLPTIIGPPDEDRLIIDRPMIEIGAGQFAKFGGVSPGTGSTRSQTLPNFITP